MSRVGSIFTAVLGGLRYQHNADPHPEAAQCSALGADASVQASQTGLDLLATARVLHVAVVRLDDDDRMKSNYSGASSGNEKKITKRRWLSARVGVLRGLSFSN